LICPQESPGFPRDRVRASELRDAIMEIARRSDQIKQQLTQLDQY